MDFIVATTNSGKAKEFLSLLGDGHTVRTLADIGFTDEIVEYGKTFAENAAIKALAVHKTVNISYDYIIADDSGLVIDALSGKPGVYSARWLGADTPYLRKNEIIIDMLKDIPADKRTARFICAMAAIDRIGQTEEAECSLEGFIADKPAGTGGFGYDPIFYLSEKNCTLAELSLEEKNRISHRYLAIKSLYKKLNY